MSGTVEIDTYKKQEEVKEVKVDPFADFAKETDIDDEMLPF